MTGTNGGAPACQLLHGDVDGFYTQYAHARDIGLDFLAEGLWRLQIRAETPLVAEKRVQKADGSVEITTLDAVDRSRLTVDTQWNRGPPASFEGPR